MSILQAIGETALALGLGGPARHHVTDFNDVLAHTSALQPRASESIFFTAPSTAGEFDFVCSLPGHAALMNGKLVVE